MTFSCTGAKLACPATSHLFLSRSANLSTAFVSFLFPSISRGCPEKGETWSGIISNACDTLSSNVFNRKLSQPRQEIVRARFAVNFRTLTLALPVPFSSLFLPFVGTDFTLCVGSVHKVIQQTFIVPCDAVFMTFLIFCKTSTYLSLQCLPQVQSVCACALFSTLSRRVMDCGPQGVSEGIPVCVFWCLSEIWNLDFFLSLLKHDSLLWRLHTLAFLYISTHWHQALSCAMLSTNL